jgi:hypothetical protein
MRPRPVEQVRQLTIVRDAALVDLDDPQALLDASQVRAGGGVWVGCVWVDCVCVAVRQHSAADLRP